MKRKRPFKARWFSSDLGQHVGASYATRAARDARAEDANQYADVTVWEVDVYGYAKPGTFRTLPRPR